MQISLSWLNDYISIAGIAPATIAEALTALGLEVEGVATTGSIKGKVVVGRIVEASPLPQSDKLRLCQVAIGSEKPLTIVCGAANARTGLHVAVATIGSELPGGFKIKEAQIRGQLSQGMLCSEEELGLAAKSDGIIELGSDHTLGTSIAEIFGLNDTVVSLNITPNRGDCLSYLGVARELAAKFNLPLLPPKSMPAPTSGSLKTTDHLKVKLSDTDGCSRFSALYIQDVTNTPSPAWLAQRLDVSGIRPLNLIVDVTNYVMLENGHPIHAYDERDITGSLIEVRSARSNETLVTLDGQRRQLVSDDIVIADSTHAIGLAGIMGGENSAIKPDTHNIIVEVAEFHPARVRKTARRLALHTDASHRFERQIDGSRTVDVLFRVAALLQQCTAELNAQGQTLPLPQSASDPIDHFPSPLQAKKIALRLARVRQILGLHLLTQEECIAYLSRLGFQCLDKTDGRMLFEVPKFRHDIEREVDLIEEVARVMGYDKIPTTLPMMEIRPLPEDPFIDFVDRAKSALAQCGLNEVISFPFLGRKDLERLNVPKEHPFARVVSLANPLADDQSILQPTLIPNLLRAMQGNQRRGRRGVRLFEAGRCFLDHGALNLPDPYLCLAQRLKQGRHISGQGRQDVRPIERTIISGILDQPYVDKSWHSGPVPANFYTAKAVVSEFLRSFGIADVRYSSLPGEALPWLLPGQSAAIYIGEDFAGYCGELHPLTTLAFDLELSEAPIVFELDLETVFDQFIRPKAFRSESSKFPAVTRDLAFIVPRTVTHENMSAAITKFPRKKHLSTSRLFDVYFGDNLPPTKKSMAYSLAFRSPDRTLKDDEVDQEITALITWMKEAEGAELR